MQLAVPHHVQLPVGPVLAQVFRSNAACSVTAGVLPGPPEYTLYLIVSAHMQGASQHDNAVATANLIKAFAQEHTVEVVFGVFEGEREVSVKVSGFESMSDAISSAQVTIANFGQQCVLLVDDKNVAWSITARTVVSIGPTYFTTHNPVTEGVVSYTQLMDGTYLVAVDRYNTYALAA